MNGYKMTIDKALTQEDLNWVVEMAAHDEKLTNDEYAEIYAYALLKAQGGHHER